MRKKIIEILTVPVLLLIGYFSMQSNIDADINVVKDGKVFVEYNQKIVRELIVSGEKTEVISKDHIEKQIQLDCGKMKLVDCDNFYNQMDSDSWSKTKLESHIKKVLSLNDQEIIRIY